MKKIYLLPYYFSRFFSAPKQQKSKLIIGRGIGEIDPKIYGVFMEL